MISLLLTFLAAFLLGWYLRAAHERRHKKTLTPTVPSTVEEQALIVSFLRTRGAANVLDLSVDMAAHTAGLHTWIRKKDGEIYALLRTLEADGVVTSRENSSEGRVYRLVADRKDLLDVPTH